MANCLQIWVNDRNPHKILAVRIYPCGHWYWQQSMRWTENGVLNWLGARHRCLHRISVKTARATLADYHLEREVDLCDSVQGNENRGRWERDLHGNQKGNG